MRDFRNAKAIAQTLRAALAAKGFKITVSQSLELIAEMFGVADWNTLAATMCCIKSSGDCTSTIRGKFSLHSGASPTRSRHRTNHRLISSWHMPRAAVA